MIHYSIGRRISLFRIGYRRPPFLLWQRETKGIRSVNFFRDAGYEGITSNFPRTIDEKECSKTSKKEYAVYLWPDRLRWHFFFLGICLGGAFLLNLNFKTFIVAILSLNLKDFIIGISNLNIKAFIVAILTLIKASIIGISNLSFKDFIIPTILNFNLNSLITAIIALLGKTFIVGIIAFLWMVFVIPIFTFRCCGIPVMNHIWYKWPPSLEGWLEGIIQYGYNSPKPNIGYFEACRPPIAEPDDSIYWCPSSGSEQESFLRAAIIEMFPDSTGKVDSSFFHETAFRRWIFYWCSPVWGSLVFLSILLAFTAAFPLKPVDDPDHLILPIIVWLIYSIFFILREADYFNHWRMLDGNDYRFLPPTIKPIIGKESLGDILTDPKIQAVANFLISAIVVIYLTAISILSSSSSIGNVIKKIDILLIILKQRGM